jgi:hypothetical protein
MAVKYYRWAGASMAANISSWTGKCGNGCELPQRADICKLEKLRRRGIAANISC